MACTWRRLNTDRVFSPVLSRYTVPVASGFIAGEALLGLLVAGWTFAGEFPTISFFKTEVLYRPLAVWLAIPVALFLFAYLIYVPLTKAGRADEPAPPTAVM